MEQRMVLRQYTCLRAVLIAALTLISITLVPAETQAQRKEDIYSRRYVDAIMSRVYDWQIANPVEINQRNSNLWARAAFYTGLMAAYSTTHAKQTLQQPVKWPAPRQCQLRET